MIVATFNINGINKRLGNLLAWLKERAPDVVCLQELKCTDSAFPIDAIEGAGYSAVWAGESRWNGVAILSRDKEIFVTQRSLPGDAADKQARYLEAVIGGRIIASLYAPNGNPQPGPKFDYKINWLERLRSHAGALLATGAPVILAGDFNVVPEPHDIYETTSYDDNALVQPEARAAYRAITDMGLHDALRPYCPDGGLYTFWDYRRRRWERNGGMRIDHILHDPGQTPRDVFVDRHLRGLENASDHAPVVAEFPD